MFLNAYKFKYLINRIDTRRLPILQLILFCFDIYMYVFEDKGHMCIYEFSIFKSNNIFLTLRAFKFSTGLVDIMCIILRAPQHIHSKRFVSFH